MYNVNNGYKQNAAGGDEAVRREILKPGRCNQNPIMAVAQLIQSTAAANK